MAAAPSVECLARATVLHVPDLASGCTQGPPYLSHGMPELSASAAVLFEDVTNLRSYKVQWRPTLGSG